MTALPDPLLARVRDSFAHVDTCPFQGPRVFFENAGGALTLKSVLETSNTFAAIPDNQGRDNPAAHALVAKIAQANSLTDEQKKIYNAAVDLYEQQKFAAAKEKLKELSS